MERLGMGCRQCKSHRGAMRGKAYDNSSLSLQLVVAFTVGVRLAISPRGPPSSGCLTLRQVTVLGWEVCHWVTPAAPPHPKEEE